MIECSPIQSKQSPHHPTHLTLSGLVDAILLLLNVLHNIIYVISHHRPIVWQNEESIYE